MKLNQILFFALAAFIVYSCGNNEVEATDPSELGYSYFPLEVGDSWVYSVDSLKVIQGGISNESTSSEIKEEVVELISESNDEKTYRLERSYRKDASSIWSVTDVWTATKDDIRATKTEENLRIIKMVFPASEGVSWDGNAFFDDSKFFPVGADEMQIYLDWNYRIESKGSPLQLGDQLFEDVLLVDHVNDTTIISLRYATETYANGIGLVERKMSIFDTQNQDLALDWEDRAEVGFKLHQKLISFTRK